MTSGHPVNYTTLTDVTLVWVAKGEIPLGLYHVSRAPEDPKVAFPLRGKQNARPVLKLIS